MESFLKRLGTPDANRNMWFMGRSKNVSINGSLEAGDPSPQWWLWGIPDVSGGDHCSCENSKDTRLAMKPEGATEPPSPQERWAVSWFLWRSKENNFLRQNPYLVKVVWKPKMITQDSQYDMNSGEDQVLKRVSLILKEVLCERKPLGKARRGNMVNITSVLRTATITPQVTWEGKVRQIQALSHPFAGWPHGAVGRVSLSKPKGTSAWGACDVTTAECKCTLMCLDAIFKHTVTP